MLSIFKGDQAEIRPRDPGSIWQGIAIGGAWNVCALLLGLITIFIMIGIAIVAGFGLVQ